jgi:glycosyltransferase involved in cell wall biosynthesis
MSISVLHLGNVAQNGYNNAKLLRRLGLQAWAVCDEAQALAQPEWEDASLPAGTDAMAVWVPTATTDGWRRPDWVIAPRTPPRRLPGWYRAAYAFELAAARSRLRRLYRSLAEDYEPLRSVLGSDLTLADVVAGFRAGWMHSLLLGDLRALFRRFELVQAYATHATLPLVVAPERPFVAYEHGTLRELPFEDSWRGRLLSLAYRRAAKVIITNADVISSARRLGLENTIFIPHPVDESKYTPGASELGNELRAQGAGPIVLAPARQDWREKRNDVMVRALGELVRGGYPKTLLFLGDWGEDRLRTRALARDLGLEQNVRWTSPVPKLQLIELYRAADVVLDQFTFGTFGGIAPEAMACERPVVMAFDRALHDWCFPEQPPIVDARNERTLAEALVRLARDPDERARLGGQGRAWVERHHGWRLVAERQRAVYEEVLRVSA